MMSLFISMPAKEEPLELPPSSVKHEKVFVSSSQFKVSVAESQSDNPAPDKVPNDAFADTVKELSVPAPDTVKFLVVTDELLIVSVIVGAMNVPLPPPLNPTRAVGVIENR